MTAVLLIIHLLVTVALVAVILMQRSEGGALGIGGGGPGGMMSGRGAANLLTRTTMVLGALFIANSIILAVLSGVDSTNRSVIDRAGETRDSELPFDFDEPPAGSDDAPADLPADAPQDAPAEEEPALPNR
ncbi:MAG: preprotein translocase subunit SecG [Oceanicaulis sp.]